MRSLIFVCLVGALALLMLLPLRAGASAGSTLAQAPMLTPTPVPPGYAPDRCEPNDTLVQPCAIPNEVETGDLTFVDDVTDVYSALLKGRRTYTIRAASTSGIDPALAVYLADATEQPITQNDDLAAGSGDAVVQITTPADGWYLIQVENKAVGDMRGRTYALSVRSSAPQGATGGPAATPAPEQSGDAFENNYRLEDAPRLAWGVPYDLSLVCPETRTNACPSGDHDFFLVPVKQGVPFVAASYDLGPGADTTIGLYAPAPGHTDPGTGIPGWRLLQGNDDAVRGRTLRSQVLTTPTWDGEVLLIVAASDRSDPPRLPEAAGPPARYRLIVGSPFLPAVQQVLQAQQDAPPAPTSVPSIGNDGSTGIPQPANPTSAPAVTVLPTAVATPGDAEEIIHEECLTGVGVVINPEGAHFSAAAVPSRDSRYLMIYPAGVRVELLGNCYLGWVKVRPLTAVSPGWMYAPDLELSEATGALPAASATPDPLMPADTTDPAVLPPSNALPTARPLEVAPLPTRVLSAPTALPRQALTVAVQVLDGEEQPRPGLRVQLVDVLGTVLREGTTDAQGRIDLVADLPATAAVWVQLPAPGLTAPVDRATPAITIVVPGREDGL